MVEYFSNHHGDFYSVPRQNFGLPTICCASVCLKQNCGLLVNTVLEMADVDEELKNLADQK